MKFDAIKEKGKAIIIKIGKRNTVLICAVMLIAIAVIVNVLLFGPSDRKNESALNMALDLNDLSSAVADGENESSVPTENGEDDYFATTTLSRQRARDEAIEVLQAIVDNADAVEEMREQALMDINEIAANMEAETNIETLVMAKGFDQCVAVISGEMASVIVSGSGLLDSELAQIKEIVYEQAGILPANLKIIEKTGT